MKEGLVEIIFVLDRSGSMQGLEDDTIGGFNAFVEKQRKSGGEVRVTAVLFDDRYELLWEDVPAEEVRLTEREYYVRGSTALYDAVGKTILEVGRRLERKEGTERPAKVIVVIITDGLENSSREFSFDKIKGMIRHQRQKYHWDFVFFGAHIESVREAEHFGIGVKDAFCYEASKNGLKQMYDKASEVVTHKRQEK